MCHGRGDREEEESEDGLDPLLWERTRLEGPDDYRRKLFCLARELKAVFPNAKLPDLEPYVRRWAERAGIEKPFEEVLTDFLFRWEKVEYPAGTGPVDDLFRKARMADVPEEAKRFEQASLRLLVALCRELQREAGAEKSWFLDCRTAGRLLGVGYKTASRWLKLLVAYEILELVEKGQKGTGGVQGKASKYRYRGSRQESRKDDSRGDDFDFEDDELPDFERDDREKDDDEEIPF